MSKGDKFYMFPLSALYFGKSILKVNDIEMKERLEVIEKFCFLDVGRKAVKKLDSDSLDTILQEYFGHEVPEDLTDDEMAAAVGLNLFRYNMHSIGIVRGTQVLLESMAFIESIKRSAKTITIRQDIFLTAKRGEVYSWRDFSVLCAILAGIGTAQTRQLSFDYINLMAHGFTKNAELPEYLPPRHAVRYTVRALERRKIFVYGCYNGRHNTYSIRHDINTLGSAIVEFERKKIEHVKRLAIEKAKHELADLRARNLSQSRALREKSSLLIKQSKDVPRKAVNAPKMDSISTEQDTERARQAFNRAINGLDSCNDENPI